MHLADYCNIAPDTGVVPSGFAAAVILLRLPPQGVLIATPITKLPWGLFPFDYINGVSSPLGKNC